MNDLYAHQRRFLEVNPDKCLVVHDTGTGKTRTSIEWMKMRKRWGPALVICPKALKKNWQRELEKWGAVSTYVYTKEEFRRDWKTMPLYRTIVVDEAHYFSGKKSLMTKALRSYVKRVHPIGVLLLTATPYLSTPWNIYTLAGHLGYEWSYTKFLDRFFVDRYIGRRIIHEVREGIEDEIAELVRKIGDVVPIDECADIPEQIFETEVFELTPEQVKTKKEIMEVNPVVRYTKYHMIENGILKGDEYVPDKFYDTAKDARVMELCEANRKVIVVCRYNLQIDALATKLEKLGKPIFVIRGEVKDRDAVVQQAEAAEDAIVLIQASCSEGYQLPSFPLMVFASMDFSYKNYKQLIGRILRIDKLKKNVYVHLVTEGIDTAVYNAIMKKQSFDAAVYERETEFQGEGLPDTIQ